MKRVGRDGRGRGGEEKGGFRFVILGYELLCHRLGFFIVVFHRFPAEIAVDAQIREIIGACLVTDITARATFGRLLALLSTDVQLPITLSERQYLRTQLIQDWATFMPGTNLLRDRVVHMMCENPAFADETFVAATHKWYGLRFFRGNLQAC
jgi:hypothetical protein